MQWCVATGADHDVSKQDTSMLQRPVVLKRQIIKWNVLMRKENSHDCIAALGRLDWAAPEAQSLVLISWLLCFSFYTCNTIEVAVSHSVNGVQKMFSHLEDWVLWSPPSSDNKFITNIKENRFQFMKIWKLQNTSYWKMYIFGQIDEESS